MKQDSAIRRRGGVRETAPSGADPALTTGCTEQLPAHSVIPVWVLFG